MKRVLGIVIIIIMAILLIEVPAQADTQITKITPSKARQGEVIDIVAEGVGFQEGWTAKLYLWDNTDLENIIIEEIAAEEAIFISSQKYEVKGIDLEGAMISDKWKLILGGVNANFEVEGETPIPNPQLPYTWYLAEGSTGGDPQSNFETWISIMNPNEEDTTVDIAYMTDTERVNGPEFVMSPRTRKTINVADVVPDTWSVSSVIQSDLPIVVTRSMYWNDRVGGHCSLGVQDIGKKWYVAEGSTKGGFETWILIQNPGLEDAEVIIVYLSDDEEKRGPALTVQAESRVTINVADSVPDTWSIATEVQADRDIIVESAMYWGGRQGGLESVGYLVD